MFEFYSKLSFIGKVIFWLGLLVIFCSVCSQCIVCQYVPIKMVVDTPNYITDQVDKFMKTNKGESFLNTELKKKSKKRSRNEEESNNFNNYQPINETNTLEEFFEDIRQIDYDIQHSKNNM